MKAYWCAFVFYLTSLHLFAQTEKLNRQLTFWQMKPASVERDTNLILLMGALAESLSNKLNPRAKVINDSLKIFVEKNPKWIRGKAIYERSIGKYYDRKGDYLSAIDHYIKANTFYEKIKYDLEGQSFCYILTGFLLNNNQNWQECIKYLEKAKPIAEKLSNTNNLCFIYDFYGDYNYYSNYEIEDYKKALEYYQKVETLLDKNSNPFHFADNPHGLANCYFRLGNNKMGEFYFKKAIKIADSLNQKNVLFATYDNIAQIFLAQKNYQKAIEFAEKGLSFAKQDRILEFILRAEKSISEVYKEAGQYEKAYKHYIRYDILEDSLGKNRFNSDFEKLKSQLEVEKNLIKIAELENERLNNSRRILIISVLFLLILVTSIITYNYKLRQQNTLLSQKNNEIKEALLKGQTLERKRMASELHDNIANKILGVKMRVELLENQKFTEKEKISHQTTLRFIDEVYSDIRLVSHNLLPEELENNGLIDALNSLVKKLNLIGKTHFRFKSETNQSRFGGRIEYEIYSIILELVNNTLKHSEAQEADISINQNEKFLKIEVSDNGIGFKHDTINFDSMGLKNIRSRVESLKGEVLFASNKGTKVEISIPI